jgi:hypothetical protein
MPQRVERRRDELHGAEGIVYGRRASSSLKNIED